MEIDRADGLDGSGQDGQISVIGGWLDACFVDRHPISGIIGQGLGVEDSPLFFVLLLFFD